MTSTLITVAQLREHVETDLPDTALQRLVDDADAEIQRRYGPHSTTTTETFSPSPGDSLLFLTRQCGDTASVVVTEKYPGTLGETTIVLDTTDYEWQDNNRTLRRLPTGTHGPGIWTDTPGQLAAWAPWVTVAYTPAADDARRVRVLIDLCKLAVVYDATSMTMVGKAFQTTQLDYARERNRLMAVLAPPNLGFFA